eukprot:scaffold1785_cov247-Pinguiococcus_pyrenoidosus.AAC.9
MSDPMESAAAEYSCNAQNSGGNDSARAPMPSPSTLSDEGARGAASCFTALALLLPKADLAAKKGSARPGRGKSSASERPPSLLRTVETIPAALSCAPDESSCSDKPAPFADRGGDPVPRLADDRRAIAATIATTKTTRRGETRSRVALLRAELLTLRTLGSSEAQRRAAAVDVAAIGWPSQPRKELTSGPSRKVSHASRAAGATALIFAEALSKAFTANLVIAFAPWTTRSDKSSNRWISRLLTLEETLVAARTRSKRESASDVEARFHSQAAPRAKLALLVPNAPDKSRPREPREARLGKLERLLTFSALARPMYKHPAEKTSTLTRKSPTACPRSNSAALKAACRSSRKRSISGSLPSLPPKTRDSADASCRAQKSETCETW